MKSTMLAAATLLCTTLASGQELTTARYVGSLDGGVEACVAAFPAQASRYRAAPQLAWSCRGDAQAYRKWHDEQQHALQNRDEYRRGYVEGRNSLSGTSAQQAQLCQSLLEIPCHPEPATR